MNPGVIMAGVLIIQANNELLRSLGDGAKVKKSDEVEHLSGAGKPGTVMNLIGNQTLSKEEKNNNRKNH